jgi:hypothetical protein
LPAPAWSPPLSRLLRRILPTRCKRPCQFCEPSLCNTYRPDQVNARRKPADESESGAVGCRHLLSGDPLRAQQDRHKGACDIKTPDEKIAPENCRFRAITQTDKDGRFVFETIVPGRYAIPPNLEGFEQYAGQIRPAHYHITITHPIYVPLATQIYIKGDPYIAKDPWAQHSRNVFELKSGGAVAMGSFEIVLANQPGQAPEAGDQAAGSRPTHAE